MADRPPRGARSAARSADGWGLRHPGRGRGGVAAAPDLHLLGAVDRRGLGLVEALEGAVVALVQPPGAFDRHPHLVHLVEHDPQRADGALEHRGEGAVDPRPSPASALPAARASATPAGDRSTSTHPVNRFCRFQSLWPWRTRISVGKAASFRSGGDCVFARQAIRKGRRGAAFPSSARASRPTLRGPRRGSAGRPAARRPAAGPRTRHVVVRPGLFLALVLVGIASVALAAVVDLALHGRLGCGRILARSGGRVETRRRWGG